MKTVVIDNMGYVYAGTITEAARIARRLPVSCAVSVADRRDLPTHFRQAQYSAVVSWAETGETVGLVRGCESMEDAIRLSILAFPWRDTVVSVYHSDVHGNTTVIAKSEKDVFGDTVWKIF